MGTKIKLGDTVKVVSGASKGKIDEVIAQLSDQYIIVKGVNVVKKCVKRDPQRDQEGGFIEKEAKIHISNVALYNRQKKKTIKVGFKFVDKKKNSV